MTDARAVAATEAARKETVEKKRQEMLVATKKALQQETMVVFITLSQLSQYGYKL